jgi:tetratricopeptide (TPR) repeat protein
MGRDHHEPRQPPSALDLLRQPPTILDSIGQRALAAGDPVLAFAAYRAMQMRAGTSVRDRHAARLGLGRCWLMVAEPELALAYADALIAERGDDAAAWALRVRALLRDGDFSLALQAADEATARVAADPELRAARAAALFRNQRLSEAEAEYRSVLREDPIHAEALVRLGTGLLPPRPAAPAPELHEAASLQRRGRYDDARLLLASVLGREPEHPTGLRMLGELVISMDRDRSPLLVSGVLPRLWQEMAPVIALDTGLRGFFPDWQVLDADRRRMVVLGARPFTRQLGRVAAAGGSHDLLLECERTTDAESRAWLRGRRTFDGRVWDDVRGIGGLGAATGIEALDDAHVGGFHTLVHELAHQVHVYALTETDRARITDLYCRAKQQRRCLDYYAESDEAEYFAQGVEAWFSLVKAAGQPVTHGHTRFELERKDPELAMFISRIAEWDPLTAGGRELRAALVRAAIAVGRARDARALLECGGDAAPAELAREVARAENRLLSL